MKQTEKTLVPETSLLVEALQAVLQVEDKCFSSFSLIYGSEIPEGGGKTGGEIMYSKTGLPEIFEDLKNEIKSQIGETIELDLQGLLKDPEKKEEVC